LNQHYVPRSYLKNFAEQKGKEFFVPVYDKKADRFFNANIKKICSEIDLYTLQEGNPITKDLLTVEKIYANGIEPLYTKAYNILTNHKIHTISLLQRTEMLIGIFQLYVRNPAMLRKSISFHEKEILKGCREARTNGHNSIKYLDEEFSFQEWNEEAIIKFCTNKITQDFKEKHIGGVGEIGDFHQHVIFDVSVITDDSEFITTDNPLIFEDLISDNEYPLQRSKEFTIALNKKVAVKLYHDKTKQLNRIYRHVEPNGSVEIINKEIINRSSRFVIATKEILDKHKIFAAKFLDITSLGLKIDAIRQILSKFPVTRENKDAVEVMRYYLNKHDNERALTDMDVYEMHLKLQDLSRRFISKRVN